MKKLYLMIFVVITLAGMLAISGCKKKETYTVTFNPNGGTGTMEFQTFTEGEAQALTRNAFTYDGYTFTGWNTVQGGSGASYTDQQTITVTADMTLYAQWTSNGTNPTPGPTPSNTVTVTFDANGGTGEMAPQTFTTGVAQILTANAFTKGNYPFNGWNTAADGSGTDYANMQEITVSANVTLYAQWSAYEYVDLGLPSGTKWATCNVGSTTPEGYGDYFAWGETSTKTTYSWSTYRYCNGSFSTLTKYCNKLSYGNNGFTDALTTLEASDDAATANWGSAWRMPTKEDMEELKSYCTREWTTQNGVNGRLLTGPNGNSVFLPAAGYRTDSELYTAGSHGAYWLSSLGASIPYLASSLSFDSGYFSKSSNGRSWGLSVRPVCASQN